MTNLHILLVDDHEVVRRGLRALLTSHAGWEVVGEAGDGQDAVEMARQLKPEVIVMDVSMPKMNGLDATRCILETAPQTAVLIFTMHQSAQIVREVAKTGARGYVLKSDAGQDLILAVEALSRNETFFKSGSEDPVSKAA